MTSNLGADLLLSSIKEKGIITPEIRTKVMDIVRKNFKPEFLNRLDDVVMFHPLGEKDLNRIVRLQVDLLSKRLEEKDIAVDLGDRAVELILKNAYDPVYGARPLKRYLEKNIVTQLSR